MRQPVRKRAVGASGAAALAAVIALCTPPLAASAAAASGPGVQAAGTVVRDCGSGPALSRPGSLILTCADDGELATSLHWTSWTASKATAIGTVTWRACTAMCADSRRVDHTTADFTLTHPVARRGKSALFTRLTMHVTGPTPHGFMRNLTWSEAPTGAAAPRPAYGHATARTPAAASGTLGYAQIEGFWIIAGGPNGSAGSYTDAQVAAAITGAESSFEPGIIQQGVDYCGAGSNRAGWGLWQITCGNSVSQYGTDFQILDPWNNAEAAVYKCHQDMAAGVNCFDPWSTYTNGTYAQHLQHTSPDTNITDPGEYVQAGSTPPGTPSSPGPNPGSKYGPPMPGSGPGLVALQSSPAAVYGSQMELFGKDASGATYSDVYSPSVGKWSGWQDLGGNLAGDPTAVQYGDQMEVFGRAASGATYSDVWSSSSGKWSGWQDLGGNLTSNPVAIEYNTATYGDQMEVYGLAANGQAYSDVWTPSTGKWSGWYSLGGNLTGSLSVALYGSQMEVFGRDSTGATYSDVYTPSSGKWSGWQDLGGNITDTPVAAEYQSATYGDQMEVYGLAANGQAYSDVWTPSTGKWSGWYSLGGGLTGDLSVVQYGGQMQVFGRDSSGVTYSDVYTPSAGKWSGWQNLAGNITDNPVAVDYNTASYGDQMEVYGRAANGQTYSDVWTPSSGKWSGWYSLGGNLTG